MVRGGPGRYDARWLAHDMKHGMSRSLLRSTTTVGGMTLISRVLGFVRDTLFAVLFGAGPGMDAFLVAFKIPNFMRRLFAEGAFAQAFVPVLAETKTSGEPEDVQALVDVVAGTLGGVLVLITAVGVVAAPALVFIFAPGFIHEAHSFSLSVTMLRFTFPYLMFMSLTALAGGILNTYGRFAVPAFTPVLLNLCLIGAAVGLAPLFPRPEVALAVAVLAAGVIQLAFQLPFLRRIGFLPRPRWGWRNPVVRRIMRLMLPVLFGSSVTQISLLLDTMIASFLGAGSVSWLYYSDRLMEFPLGVFTLAISTVILPSLSAHHAKASREEFSATLDWALRLLLTIALPAMVGLFVLAGPLVTTLFHYHSFDTHDVYMTRASLEAFAFGMMGFSLVKVLVPGFYARQDTMTPVRCGIVAMCCNMVLNVVFVLAILGWGGSAPHAGLALATSCGAFINAGQLYWRLRREGAYNPLGGWKSLGMRLACANVVMAAFLLYFSGPLKRWLAWDALHRFEHLLALVFGAMALYFAVLALLGARPRHLYGARS